MSSAYACGSGGVIFVPDEIEKTTGSIIVNLANANDDQEDQE